MPGIPRAMLDRPTSILLRGDRDRWTGLAGLGMALAVSPGFVLIEIEQSGSDRARDRIDWDRFVPSERHFRVTPTLPGTPTGPGPAGVPWPMRRADRPSDVIASLFQFIQEPEVGTRLFRSLVPKGRPLAVLVAHGAPAARQFPDDPRVASRLMDLQKQFGYTTVFTSDLTARTDYLAFDFAFDVSLPSADPMDLRLRCVRAPWRESLKPGDELRLGVIGEFTRALAGRDLTPFLPEGTSPSSGVPPK